MAVAYSPARKFRSKSGRALYGIRKFCSSGKEHRMDQQVPVFLDQAVDGVWMRLHGFADFVSCKRYQVMDVRLMREQHQGYDIAVRIRVLLRVKTRAQIRHV